MASPLKNKNFNKNENIFLACPGPLLIHNIFNYLTYGDLNSLNVVHSSFRELTNKVLVLDYKSPVKDPLKWYHHYPKSKALYPVSEAWLAPEVSFSILEKLDILNVTDLLGQIKKESEASSFNYYATNTSNTSSQTKRESVYGCLFTELFYSLSSIKLFLHKDRTLLPEHIPHFFASHMFNTFAQNLTLHGDDPSAAVPISSSLAPKEICNYYMWRVSSFNALLANPEYPAPVPHIPLITVKCMESESFFLYDQTRFHFKLYPRTTDKHVALFLLKEELKDEIEWRISIYVLHPSDSKRNIYRTTTYVFNAKENDRGFANLLTHEQVNEFLHYDTPTGLNNKNTKSDGDLLFAVCAFPMIAKPLTKASPFGVSEIDPVPAPTPAPTPAPAPAPSAVPATAPAPAATFPAAPSSLE